MGYGGGENFLKNLGILGMVFPGTPESLLLLIEIASGNSAQLVVAEVVAEIVIADIFLGVMDMIDVSADCMTILAIWQHGGRAIAVKSQILSLWQRSLRKALSVHLVKSV